MIANIAARHNWVDVRFRYLADVQKGCLPSPVTDTRLDMARVPYLTMEYLRGESSEPTLVPLNERSVVAGDDSILLLWDGANAGEFLRAKPGVVSSTSALVTPRSVDSTYFYWACKGQEDRVRAQTEGMYLLHVNGDFLADIRISVPPLPQQRAIGDYLDRETARLDALVVAKERVLDLLAERHRALVTYAVTRGVDSDAQLRASQVSWLGNIPAHWKVERVKWLLSERAERSETGDEELLMVSHITGVTSRSDSDVNMFEEATTMRYKLCHSGDLVVNTLWAWMGAMGVSPVDGMVSPAYNVYIPGPRLLSGYIDALVRMPAFVQEVKRYSKGAWSSRLRLYPEGLFEISLPVPPLHEQEEIVAQIRYETSKLSHLQSATERSIALLKERRSALIFVAVTGQADLGRDA
ncbi:MAG: restriction endonuclease subunit S [Caldilineaceae bacterium]|nr:restriction endonuclease subunit S [Caldilineaceae bacterium]